MPIAAPDTQQGAEQSRTPADLEAFFAMADKWRLSADEQITLLGSPGRSTFFKWKKDGGTLPADTRERLSHILGIWKSLRILFTQDERGEAWVRAKNRYFDGASALDVMLDGMEGIIRVRRYLDAQRGT
jgi:antitoxin Xre/MbcA/ParS-like protein